jgi:hypothetical protein
MTAVLFDFSGTLVRVESTESGLRAVLVETGHALPELQLLQAARALEEAGAPAGGAAPVEPPEEPAEVWAMRDESAELHGRPSRACPGGCRCPTRAARRAVRTAHGPRRLGPVS